MDREYNWEIYNRCEVLVSRLTISFPLLCCLFWLSPSGLSAPGLVPDKLHLEQLISSEQANQCELLVWLMHISCIRMYICFFLILPRAAQNLNSPRATLAFSPTAPPGNCQTFQIFLRINWSQIWPSPNTLDLARCPNWQEGTIQHQATWRILSFC